MAQAGFTPIITYHSTTPSAVPTAANLAPGELALNIADMKLYCENSSGVVTVIADAARTGTVTSVAVSGGTTGLTTSGGPITGSGTITLSGTLAVANGGTGITSFGTGVATWLGTPSSANLAAAVTDETGSGSLVFATSPTLTTPNLGTPSAATLTNATGLPLSTGVTGQLPLANGGTGANLVDPNADRILFWDDSAGAVTWLTAGTGLTISGTTISASSGSGTVTSVSGTGTVNGITLTGTVTTSGSLTLGGTLSGVSLTSQVTGTLPVGNGGTGGTTFTANNVLLGNGTSAFQVVAPGTNGNVLTSNGTTWVSSPASGGGISTGKAIAMVIVFG